MARGDRKRREMNYRRGEREEYGTKEGRRKEKGIREKGAG